MMNTPLNNPWNVILHNSTTQQSLSQSHQALSQKLSHYSIPLNDWESYVVDGKSYVVDGKSDGSHTIQYRISLDNWSYLIAYKTKNDFNQPFQATRNITSDDNNELVENVLQALDYQRFDALRDEVKTLYTSHNIHNWESTEVSLWEKTYTLSQSTGNVKWITLTQNGKTERFVLRAWWIFKENPETEQTVYCFNLWNNYQRKECIDFLQTLLEDVNNSDRLAQAKATL